MARSDLSSPEKGSSFGILYFGSGITRGSVCARGSTGAGSTGGTGAGSPSPCDYERVVEEILAGSLVGIEKKVERRKVRASEKD